tara:strand:+ start:8572 stop:10803 length:2232 start_codon:yes stop_codon:yes gene_type:complete
MAEELILSIKSNTKSVTKDTEDYAKSVEGVEAKLKTVNATLKEQKDILLFLQEEEVKLKQKRAGQSEYEQGLSKINKTLERTKLSIQEQRLAVGRLTTQQREAKDAVKELNESQKEQGATLLDNIGNYKVFGISLNGIKKGFTQIIPTAKMMFKTIKAGMISTGIGALVVAFGALMAWFSKTKVGAEGLSKIFKVVGAVVSILVDRLVSYGKMLYSLLTLDFEGVAENAKAAFGGLGDELSREIALTLALAEATHRLEDAQRDLSVETAKRRAEIEDLKLKAEDLNLTEAERIEALNEASAMEQDLMNKRVANAEEAVRIQQQQMTMSDNLKEDLDELAAREIALANIKRESAKIQRTLIRKTNQIQASAAHAERKRQNDWIRRQNKITNANNKLRQEARLIQEELSQRMLASDEAREKRKVEVAMLAQKKIIEESKLGQKEKDTILFNLEQKYNDDITNIEDKWIKQRKDKKIKQEIDLTNRIRENDILALTDSIDREQKAEQMELDNQLYAELASVNNLENAEELKQQIRIKYGSLKDELNKKHADEEIAQQKRVQEASVEALSKGLGVIKSIMDVQAQDLENNYEKEIELAEANGKSTEDIEEKFAEKREKQAKKMKSMKIAMAIVDTYQSAVSAYAAGLSVGGPAGLILGPVSAGLAVAAGLANVAMIQKQPLGDGGGGGGETGGTPSTTSQTPAPEMMSGAFTLSGGQAPDPIQAYVVTDDMTNSQDKLANIRRRATI